MADSEFPALDPARAPDAPIELFRQWFAEALPVAQDASAMTLSVVDAEGRPSARQVLLKEATDAGFVFFTNYQSRKAQALASNPHASLLFWWDKQGRQVRIEGSVEKVSAAESDAYFASRPRESQLGAWASPQSQEIASRQELLAAFARIEQQYAGQAVPRPPHWGGYRVIPERVEFWQAGDHRLHDRVLYLRVDNGWHKQRLAP